MSAIVTSSVPLVTDEQLAHLAPYVPVLIAVLFVLACFWADRGKPWSTDEDEPELNLAPPTVPEITSLEALRRASDRG